MTSFHPASMFCLLTERRLETITLNLKDNQIDCFESLSSLIYPFYMLLPCAVTDPQEEDCAVESILWSVLLLIRHSFCLV